MERTVHDVGKMNIPSEILNKLSRRTNLGFQLLTSHAEAVYRILETIAFPYPVAEVVYWHQERIESFGCPCGLKGDEILPAAGFSSWRTSSTR